MTLKVDTFEHDIADEIKRKDASMTEISAARKDIGNSPEDEVKKPVPVILIMLVTIFLLGLIGLIGLLYFYFTDSLLPPAQESVPVTVTDIPKVNKSLGTISPTLDREIGRYITNVEKQQAGYVFTISEYPAVFAYMLRNEEDYIDELALAVATVEIGTTPGAATSLPSATSEESKGTSTSISPQATSTKSATTSTQVSTSSTPELQSSAPYYYDVTIANQNMRVYKKGDTSVVYAFVTTSKVAVSRTTEGLLSLKSVIIR